MDVGSTNYSSFGNAGLTSQRPRAASQQADAKEQGEISRLQRVDQKVRAHEQAHLNAAAGLAVSGAHFEYVSGPDGKQYAVAGEVKIDTSEASDPQRTIEKARQIEAAALAPADPSPQDRAVAAAAAQMATAAQIELSRQKESEQQAGAESSSRAISAYQQTEPGPEPIISLFV